MILRKIQTFATTITMIGVWSNLYINYRYKKDAERNNNRE